jgi:hypothetical protein
LSCLDYISPGQGARWFYYSTHLSVNTI